VKPLAQFGGRIDAPEQLTDHAQGERLERNTLAHTA
jgi:hypothetical protein